MGVAMHIPNYHVSQEMTNTAASVWYVPANGFGST